LATVTSLLTVRQYQARYQVAERALRRRIASAGELSNQAAALLGPKAIFPAWENLTAADFPAFTVLRLEMAARCDFAGGLQLLGDRWMSYPAEVFARTLLESLAHVGWICGYAETSRDVSPGCRAICLELGMVHAMQEHEGGAVAVGALDPSTPGQSATVTRAAVERLYREAACRGRMRRPGAVPASLKEINKNLRFGPWFDVAYDLFSRLLHLQAADRMMRLNEGRLFLGYAIFGQRAQTLSLLVGLYGQLASWAIDATVGAGDSTRFMKHVNRVLDDHWLDRARNGDVDRWLGWYGV